MKRAANDKECPNLLFVTFRQKNTYRGIILNSLVQTMTVQIFDTALDSGFRCNCITAMAKGFGHSEPERWKRYNGLYDVSDWGRVGYIPTKTILNQYPNGRGYASVRFRGEEYNRPAHMMVLPMFKPRERYSPNAYRSYPFIDHMRVGHTTI